MFRYNIHDLLTIESDHNIPLPRVFRVSKVADPDLIVHIGDFDLEAFKKRSDVYCYERSFGPMKSKFLIADLFGKTKLCYSSPRYRVQSGVRKSINDMVFSIVALKLLRKNCAFVYAACLEKGGEGILIFAPSGVGKTLTSISLVRDYGLAFLSDDTVIIGKDKVAYCYPMAMKISPYHMKTSDLSLKFGRKMEMHLRRGIGRLPFIDSFVSDFCMDICELLGNVKVKRNSRIGKIFILERGDDGVKEVEGKAILNRILNYNFYSVWAWSNVFALFQYLYYNAETYLGDLLAVREQNIRHMITSSKCFIVKSLARNYDRMIVRELG